LVPAQKDDGSIEQMANPLPLGMTMISTYFMIKQACFLRQKVQPIFFDVTKSMETEADATRSFR